MAPTRKFPVLLALAASGCAGPAARPRAELAQAEQLFDSVRFLRDQLDVTRSRAAERSAHGVPVADLVREYEAARNDLERRLAALPATRLDSADRRALEIMREVAARSLRPDDGGSTVARSAARPACRYDPASLGAGQGGLDSLAARVFACYGEAARRIVVGSDTLDRLSILGLLGDTEDRAARERLFRALQPVWASVNGDDGAGSPYREMVRLRRARWAADSTPMAARAASFGLPAAEAERWLRAGLEAWRAALPDTVLEPWDYYHLAGAPGRRFRRAVPLDSLLPVNHRFYRSLGADPEILGIRYDIAPRDGKYPIAFTTFGARRVARTGSTRSEPWVFASYRLGGFDNLAELLHETGHGIHIAAINVRPALHDWPDADPFTEGVADLATLELYEPAWQRAYLGDSVPLAPSLYAKYGGVMLDMAWALFEIVVHQPGAPSPNAVWTDLTSRYLRIRPHPELSWWAMRGQLIESPGYMLNYALGAFLVADLRAALRARHAPLAAGDPSWYGLVSGELLRYGAAVPARQVVRRFLGRDPAPGALLADLARISRPGGE